MLLRKRNVKNKISRGKQNWKGGRERVSRWNNYDIDQSEVPNWKYYTFRHSFVALYTRLVFILYIYIYIYVNVRIYNIDPLERYPCPGGKTRNGITNWPTRHANKRRAVEKLKRGWRGKKNGRGGVERRVDRSVGLVQRTTLFDSPALVRTRSHVALLPSNTASSTSVGVLQPRFRLEIGYTEEI